MLQNALQGTGRTPQQRMIQPPKVNSVEIGKAWFKHNTFSFTKHIWIPYLSARHSARLGTDTVVLGNVQRDPQSVRACMQVTMSSRTCPLRNRGLWVQKLKTSGQHLSGTRSSCPAWCVSLTLLSFQLNTHTREQCSRPRETSWWTLPHPSPSEPDIRGQIRGRTEGMLTLRVSETSHENCTLYLDQGQKLESVCGGLWVVTRARGIFWAVKQDSWRIIRSLNLRSLYELKTKSLK